MTESNNKKLIDASWYGHLETVKYLVEQGADIHANGGEALALASEKGHQDIADYLKKKKERELIR